MLPPLHIFCLCLLLFSLRGNQVPTCFAVNDTLLFGQALSIGDKLVSRNGKFALGFFHPTTTISKSNTTTSSPYWYVGIWFNKIPVFTTVWVANRDKPISSKLTQAQLKFSRDGNLIIVSNNATTPDQSIVWSSALTAINSTELTSINNTSAVLMDDGNFVIVENSTNVSMWQTFDYPTDVLLPGAKFGWNKVTGFNRKSISKKSLIDPGFGSYSVELDTNGTRGSILKSLNPSVVYWSWSSDKSSMLIPILKNVLDMDPRTKGLIIPEYVDNSEEEYYRYTSMDNSSYTFVSLDISGQIKMNVWSQDKQSWQSYSQPADPCTSYATCGPFTICNGIADTICDCMQSFSQKSPQDWEFGDRTGGCVRKTQLDCSSGKNNMTSSSDIFQPIARVTLPYAPQSIKDAIDQSKCAEACLNSCSCTAYSYNNSRCSVWNGELLSVNQNDGIDNNSEDVLYLRLAVNDLQKSNS